MGWKAKNLLKIEGILINPNTSMMLVQIHKIMYFCLNTICKAYIVITW